MTLNTFVDANGVND